MPVIKKYEALGLMEQQKYDKFFNLCMFGEVKGVEEFIKEKGDILIEIHGKTAYERLKEEYENTKRDFLELRKSNDPNTTQDQKELNERLINQRKVLMILEREALLALINFKAEFKSFMDLKKKNDLKGVKDSSVSRVLRAGAESALLHISSLKKQKIYPQDESTIQKVFSLNDEQLGRIRTLTERPEFSALINASWIRYLTDFESNAKTHKEKFKFREYGDAKKNLVRNALDGLLYWAALEGDKEKYQELLGMGADANRKIIKTMPGSKEIDTTASYEMENVLAAVERKTQALNNQLIKMALTGDKEKFRELVRQGADEAVLISEEGLNLTAREVLDLNLKFGFVGGDKNLSELIHQEKDFEKVLEKEFEGNPAQTFAYRLQRIRDLKIEKDVNATMANKTPGQQFTVAHTLKDVKIESELKTQKEKLLQLAKKGDEKGFDELERALIAKGVNIQDISEPIQIGGVTKSIGGGKGSRDAIETIELSAVQLLKVNLLKKYAKSGDFKKFDTVESQLEGIDVNKITLPVGSEARIMHVPIPEILKIRISADFEKAIKGNDTVLAKELYDSGKVDPKRVESLAQGSEKNKDKDPKMYAFLNNLREAEKKKVINKPNV